MDRKTRKLMTMSDASHLWVEVDRLYVTWREEGKSWISVDDVVRVEGHSLSDYLNKC